MKKLFNFSLFYLIIGLLLGVFFREFTKLNNFTDITILSTSHTHALVLGFIFFLIIMVLEKNFNICKNKHFTSWLITYNIGLASLLVTIVTRGVLEVLNKDFAGLSHIAGTGHAILGISLIWFMFILKKEAFKK